METRSIFVSRKSGKTVLSLIALIVLGLLVQPALRTEAQEPVVAETLIEPVGFLDIAEASKGPLEDFLYNPLMQTTESSPATPPESGQGTFRPTMSPAEYHAAKEVLTARTLALPGDLQDLGVVSPFSSSLLEPSVAPDLVLANFEGLNQFITTVVLADPHGAVGKNHFCQVVNRFLAFYNKEPPNDRVLFSYLLDQDTGRGWFSEARVLYDSIWNRWVIYARLLSSSPTVQWIRVLVSETADPTGDFYAYWVNVNLDLGDFWDYGQVGLDQDAVIFTGNVFQDSVGGVFKGARAFALAKARLYNGLDLEEVPVFDGLVGTLAPPIVLDDNGNTFLVAAPPAGTMITKYRLTNSSRPSHTELAMSTIPVPFYSIPPSAIQPGPGPGSGPTIDTLDARFVNASSQVGDSLFQIHAIRNPNLPFPRNELSTLRWYEFDIATNVAIRYGETFASTTSSDWMASIAANLNKDVFVVWSSTDAYPLPEGLNPQVRFSGAEATDLAIGPGSHLITSDSVYFMFPWGRYSAVTVDPEDPACAWIVGEKVINTFMWGTQIGQICFD